MICSWLKASPSFIKGVGLVNELDDTRFEQFVRRIVSKLKIQNGEIFTEDEQNKLQKIFNVDQDNLVFCIKTIVYLFKRLIKYIFMPLELKNDLKSFGFRDEKCDCIMKVWSSEIKTTLNDLVPEISDNSQKSLDFSCKLNAELSSECCKKSKIPKAYLSIKDHAEVELIHPELYSMFQQFESIQNELDNFII